MGAYVSVKQGGAGEEKESDSSAFPPGAQCPPPIPAMTAVYSLHLENRPGKALVLGHSSQDKQRQAIVEGSTLDAIQVYHETGTGYMRLVEDINRSFHIEGNITKGSPIYVCFNYRGDNQRFATNGSNTISPVLSGALVLGLNSKNELILVDKEDPSRIVISKADANIDPVATIKFPMPKAVSAGTPIRSLRLRSHPGKALTLANDKKLMFFGGKKVQACTLGEEKDALRWLFQSKYSYSSH
jgi:hypothetical protein